MGWDIFCFWGVILKILIYIYFEDVKDIIILKVKLYDIIWIVDLFWKVG